MADQPQDYNNQGNFGYGQQGWQGNPQANYGTYQPSVMMPQSPDMLAYQSAYQSRSTMQLAQSQMMQGLNTTLQGTMMAGSAIAEQSSRMIQNFQRKFDSATTRYQDYSFGPGNYALETSLFREVASQHTGNNTFLRRLLVGARPEFLSESEYQNVMAASSDVRWNNGSKLSAGINATAGAAAMIPGVGWVASLALLGAGQASDFFIGGNEHVSIDKARRQAKLDSIGRRYGTGQSYMTQEGAADFEQYVHEASFDTYMSRAMASKFGKNSFLAKPLRADWTKDDAKDMMQEAGLFANVNTGNVEEMKKALDTGFKMFKDLAETMRTTRAKVAELTKSLMDIIPGTSINDTGLQDMVKKIANLSAVTGLAPQTFVENTNIAKQIANASGLNMMTSTEGINNLVSSLVMMQSKGRTPFLNGVDAQQVAVNQDQRVANNVRNDVFTLLDQYGGKSGNIQDRIQHLMQNMKEAGHGDIAAGYMNLRYRDVKAGPEDEVSAIRLQVKHLMSSGIFKGNEEAAFQQVLGTRGIGPGQEYKSLYAQYFLQGVNRPFLTAEVGISMLRQGMPITRELAALAQTDPAAAEARAREVADQYKAGFTTIGEHIGSLDGLSSYIESTNLNRMYNRDAKYAKLGGKKQLERAVADVKMWKHIDESGFSRQDYFDWITLQRRTAKDEVEGDGINSAQRPVAQMRWIEQFNKKHGVGKAEAMFNDIEMNMTPEDIDSITRPYREPSSGDTTDFAEATKKMKNRDGSTNIDAVKAYVAKKFGLHDEAEITARTRRLMAASGMAQGFISETEHTGLTKPEAAAMQVDSAYEHLGGKKMFFDILQEREQGNGGKVYSFKDKDVISKLTNKGDFIGAARALEDGDPATIGDRLARVREVFEAGLTPEYKAFYRGNMDRAFTSALGDVARLKGGGTVLHAVDNAIGYATNAAGNRIKYNNSAEQLLASTGKFIAGLSSRDESFETRVADYLKKLDPNMRKVLESRIQTIMSTTTGADNIREAIKKVVDEFHLEGMLPGIWSLDNDVSEAFGGKRKNAQSRTYAALLHQLAPSEESSGSIRNNKAFQQMVTYLDRINAKRPEGKKLDYNKYLEIGKKAARLALVDLEDVNGMSSKGSTMSAADRKMYQGLERELSTNYRDVLEEWAGGTKLSVTGGGLFNPQQFSEAMKNIGSQEMLKDLVIPETQRKKDAENQKSADAINTLNSLLTAIAGKLGVQPVVASGAPAKAAPPAAKK